MRIDTKVSTLLMLSSSCDIALSGGGELAAHSRRQPLCTTKNHSEIALSIQAGDRKAKAATRMHDFLFFWLLLSDKNEKLIFSSGYVAQL